MSNLYRQLFFSLLLTTMFFITISAQNFDGEWICAYATTDDGANGTGIQTITVTVLNENEFVAMVSQAAQPWETDDACYIVGYRNADSTNGRLGNYDYNTAFNQAWINGFDQVFLEHARDLASRGNLIFVPNNDAAANIVVFELGADSVMSHPMRMSTNTDPFTSTYLWAIDIDDAGRVYVTTEGDSLNPSKVLVYESPEVETAWTSGHSASPLQTITLPDNGDARGITVTPGGDVIYVSNYVSEKVYCYRGDGENGYELYDGFSFTLEDTLTSAGGVFLDPAPWGLQFMPEKNILWVACANDYQTGGGYEYGRYYALNPNTGEILDTLDVAAWNLLITGAYNSRAGGTAGNVSGYTSPYNLDFDSNFNIYTNSFYGWTVDKWVYSGELPTIELLITSIEKVENQVPTEFSLNQNYPNPFNPTTTIEFSLTENSQIDLTVYSLTGELITHLVKSKDFSKGAYKVTFDASRLASGTYIYKLDNGKNVISKKMSLIK